ncbi:hypothetical protein F4803DRAFT_226963 [Xylaria telfairii]|nr:hypothetical protein F4803DRAFT_226963 [Xylaria telfairii]
MSEPQAVVPSSPPTSFPQFARLPTELREVIWKMAMAEPRTICILGFPAKRTPLTLAMGEFKFFDAPSFFFVNRECRKLATEVYSDLRVRISSLRVVVHVDLKVQHGDGLAFWCMHDECMCCHGKLVEDDVLPAGSVTLPDTPFTLAMNQTCPVDQVPRWLWALQTDGCISWDGIELWRSLRATVVPCVTIVLYHPALALFWPS